MIKNEILTEAFTGNTIRKGSRVLIATLALLTDALIRASKSAISYSSRVTYFQVCITLQRRLSTGHCSDIDFAIDISYTFNFFNRWKEHWTKSNFHDILCIFFMLGLWSCSNNLNSVTRMLLKKVFMSRNYLDITFCYKNRSTWSRFINSHIIQATLLFANRCWKPKTCSTSWWLQYILISLS